MLRGIPGGVRPRLEFRWSFTPRSQLGITELKGLVWCNLDRSQLLRVRHENADLSRVQVELREVWWGRRREGVAFCDGHI